MRTALILLLLLAVASAVGSVIPQIPNSPEKVAAFLSEHELVGRFYLRAGLFDVFGSWWFGLIAVLLITSLVACLLPRSRAHLRAIRQRPVQARELDALPLYREIDVAATPEGAATAVRSVLRRRRFRVAAAGTSIAAEKGALREAGSLIFHWAFLLLLVGAILGKGTGYSGRATIVEGESWTDAAINYDPVHLRTGRYFGGDFSGLGLRLLDYDDDFDETGLPTRFTSTVELLDRSGEAVGRTDVEVNHPARFEDLRIHQYGFGWAPVITVEHDGEVLWDGPVVMSQRTASADRSQLSESWHGFVKLPGAGRGDEDAAIELELWPDGRSFFNEGMPMFDAYEPLMRYRLWQGRLIDPSLAGLDTRLMRVTSDGVMGEGWVVDPVASCVVSGAAAAENAGTACPADVSPALELGFPELRRYSVLLVSKDAGVPVVFVAAILIVAGLLAALYTSRRKLWVRIEPRGEGSRLVVGGFALQRKSQFDEEFARTVDACVAATGGAALGTPAGVP
jgi:cytochrome c biogenesis protein